MSARVEAAATVVAERSAASIVGLPVGPYDRETARQALAAADAVMFDDAAIERVAKTMFELHPLAKGHQPWVALKQDSRVRVSFLYDARAVIAALKGDDK